jgi:GxxExxY protein
VFYNAKKVADYRPDFVIDNKIIVELKALDFLPQKMITQLVYYLKGTSFSLGYLVNFGGTKLQIIRRRWTSLHKPDF